MVGKKKLGITAENVLKKLGLPRHARFPEAREDERMSPQQRSSIDNFVRWFVLQTSDSNRARQVAKLVLDHPVRPLPALHLRAQFADSDPQE
jgi:hypothetical protein